MNHHHWMYLRGMLVQVWMEIMKIFSPLLIKRELLLVRRESVVFPRCSCWFLDALTGSSSGDLLASTSGYHSYEPSPFNGRLKRSSILDPSAAEFHMDSDGMLSSNHRAIDQSYRRPSRTHTPTPLRYATSCK